MVSALYMLCYPGSQKSLSRKKRLEVTSPAIVVLNAFLDSSDLPKEGLSGLLWKFFWRDALIRRYLDVLFVIQLKYSNTNILRTVIFICFLQYRILS